MYGERIAAYLLNIVIKRVHVFWRSVRICHRNMRIHTDAQTRQTCFINPMYVAQKLLIENNMHGLVD